MQSPDVPGTLRRSAAAGAVTFLEVCQMKLLVIGGAGHVGRILFKMLEDQHDCVYLDLKPIPEAGERSIVGSVNDDDVVEAALDGRDAVLYLAMGTVNDDPHTCNLINPAFDVNVRGWYRVLHHSLRAGIKRYCFASTLSVYKNHQSRDESRPADSWAPYGFSKRLGEFVGEAAAQEHPDASILDLRLMFPCNESNWAEYAYDPAKERNIFATGPNDTRALFSAALKFNTPGHHVIQASGDITNQHVPNHRAHALLGWKPTNH